jgi:hypothetical protein
MSDVDLTRRGFLAGSAALASAGAIACQPGASSRPATRASPLAPAVSRVAGPPPTLVVLWLNGGPAGLFNSARSFVASGSFGVNADNVSDLGNDLLVDRGSLGALPLIARTHMASINFHHGVVRPHDHARAAVLEDGGRSQLLRMAAAMPAAMPAAGAIRCAIVNDLGLPKGVSAGPPAESGASLDFVMGFDDIAHPLDAIRTAYGVPAGDWIRDASGTFAAIEGLVHAGTSVIFAQPAYTGQPDRQFDTHRDTSGAAARAVMAPITPLLSTFLTRVSALPRNVVTVLVGEFSRTSAESDHEPGGTATVIGAKVRTGTAGPQRTDGSPPPNAPPADGLWRYVAAALGLDPKGNPNPELIDGTSEIVSVGT